MIGDKVRCSECALQESDCGGHEVCSHPSEDKHDYFTPRHDLPIKREGEQTTDGLKYDVGKVDMSFLEYFPLALEQVCALSEFGAQKYSRGGFRGITDPKRCKAAMLRHYFKEEREAVDPDSGFAHDIAVAWNALASLEVRLMKEEK